MTVLTLLVACKGEEPVELPTLEILAPADGETVAAGDVAVSLLVEHFTLVEPDAQARRPSAGPLWLVPAAFAHEEEGTQAGWVVLELDGAEVARAGATQVTLSAVAAGGHELRAELWHEDGERLDPPVEAAVTFTAQ